MKYTIEIKTNFEDDDKVYTDEEIKEMAEYFLNEHFDDFDAVTFKTTCEDGRVIEIKK